MACSRADRSWTDAWFHTPRPLSSPRQRLFCFPHAGGSAQAYHSWPRGLPGDVEVKAVQLPGRTYRISEPSFTRMEELQAALLPAMLPLLDRPFSFFGHSLGALVAFELTRLLRREGLVMPMVLAVSGRQAPQKRRDCSDIHGLDDDAFVRAVVQRYGEAARALRDPDLRELALPSLRADFELLETWSYRPEEPLDVPILILGGVDDVAVSHGDLVAWQEQTCRPATVHQFAGGHFYQDTNREELLAVLDRTLAVHGNDSVAATACIGAA